MQAVLDVLVVVVRVKTSGTSLQPETKGPAPIYNEGWEGTSAANIGQSHDTVNNVQPFRL
jgi:hypothetical protein